MPQKLNKAGKMQDYIPAGNGDPSGEYGTSKGTNKNFTASDKKKTEANVITENKSVSVDSEWLHKKIDETAKELTKTKDNNTIKKVYGTEEERDKEGAKKLGVSLEEYKKMKEQHKKEMADIFEDKERKKDFFNSRDLREYYDSLEEEIAEKYHKEKDEKKKAVLEKEINELYKDRMEAYNELKKNGKKVMYDGKEEIVRSNYFKEGQGNNKANVIDDDLTGKKENKNNYDGKIHLQGIGNVDAKKAENLKVGDITMWNFGYTETIEKIEPTKSGNMLVITIKSSDSGKTYERRMKKDRLVGITDKERKR